MIEFALATHLLACPAVAALVADRVYAESAPQGETRPFITYRLLTGAERHYHSLGASGLVEAEIEIVCRANTIEVARDVYETIRNEIDGFRGEWGGTTVNRAALTPAASATAAPAHGDEPGDPAITARLTVHYYEAVPVPTFVP